VLIGNLGTLQLVYHALQKMAVTNEMVDARDVFIFQRLGWALQGIGKLFSGSTLPIGWGEYYWAPSRVMPLGDLAITEFPLFTFLYSDLHAHMIALPLTLLAIAWSLSTLLARNLSRWGWLASLFFGGLVIGVLRPTNTWDFPTYLALGAIVTGYSIFRYVDVGDQPRFGLAPFIQRAFLGLAGMGLLVGFALLLYQPFAHWYGLAYTQVSQWTNEKTPIWSYWTQWGLFLFVIISWMVWETRQWLAQTPVSALAELKRYELIIEIGLAVAAGILLSLQFILDVPIAWFAFPVAVWALVLMLRPGQPDVKRLVLFMIGTGIVLTLIVEFIVLSGDIGRMNTVFKFYLQVWVLFAISAAAALGWILTEFDQWNSLGRTFFQVGGGLLLAGALLYPFTASMDKFRDRIAPNIPFTFDTITYMQYSHFSDAADMDLSQDYRGIRWMQENVQGSPVIVEANTVEYRWGTRYTIYTGLPGVVGWSWHQRQQRALFPGEWVTNRIQEITDFYNTGDILAAKAFLSKYDVKYIIVGQQERSMYTPDGLAKFERGRGTMWKSVYKDADTVIYQVLP
jgi:YYY domain-containing protein